MALKRTCNVCNVSECLDNSSTHTTVNYTLNLTIVTQEGKLCSDGIMLVTIVRFAFKKLCNNMPIYG